MSVAIPNALRTYIHNDAGTGYTSLDGKKSLVENRKALDPWSTKITDYLLSGAGAYYVNRLGQRILETGVEIARHSGASSENLKSFSRAATVFETAATYTCPLAVAVAVPKAAGAFYELAKEPGAQKAFGTINKTAEAAVYVLESLSHFAPMPSSVFRALDVSCAIANSSELAEIGFQYKEIGDLEGKSNLQAVDKKDLQSLKTNLLLKTTKVVTALAMSVIAILAWVLGGPIVPLIALLAMGVAACTLKIVADFHYANLPSHLKDDSELRKVVIYPEPQIVHAQ
ncbi:MAG: hypothetical protein KGJ02_03135 [Verrucomicrobiota bacterium]|nr:hypothetical protein [Verrucomicrobiota bacterium]